MQRKRARRCYRVPSSSRRLTRSLPLSLSISSYPPQTPLYLLINWETFAGKRILRRLHWSWIIIILIIPSASVSELYNYDRVRDQDLYLNQKFTAKMPRNRRASCVITLWHRPHPGPHLPYVHAPQRPPQSASVCVWVSVSVYAIFTIVFMQIFATAAIKSCTESATTTKVTTTTTTGTIYSS